MDIEKKATSLNLEKKGKYNTSLLSGIKLSMDKDSAITLLIFFIAWPV